MSNKRGAFHKFESDLLSLTEPIIAEEKLIFVMRKALIDDNIEDYIAPEKYDYKIYSFDMRSNECTKLVEYKDPKQFSVRNFYVYQNTLYYEVFTSDVNFSDIYDLKTGKYIDDQLNHDRCQIVKHNLADISEEILFDSLTTHLIGGDGGKLYISEKEEDDYDNKITEYSLLDNTMRDVFINEGDYYSSSIHNGYIIYTEMNEITVLNISTGDAKTITQNDIDIYTFSFATKEYAVLKKVGIQETYGLVPFEEFADGDIENMKTIEFDNLSLIREGV